MSLTHGALLTICQGGTVYRPNLQLLSFKKLNCSSTGRYRLLISDGMFSNSYTMMATQLNKLVTEKILDENCIVRVNNLQCNTMQGKKVIIILDVDLICSGSLIGQKIGTPIPMNSDGTLDENSRNSKRIVDHNRIMRNAEARNKAVAAAVARRYAEKARMDAELAVVKRKSERARMDMEVAKARLNAEKARLNAEKARMNVEKAIRNAEIASRNAEEALRNAERQKNVYREMRMRETKTSLELSNDLECPVCMEIPKAPKQVFQCSNGHIVCNTCLGKIQRSVLNSCPMCRENWSDGQNRPSRNFAAESTIKNAEARMKAEEAIIARRDAEKARMDAELAIVRRKSEKTRMDIKVAKARLNAEKAKMNVEEAIKNAGEASNNAKEALRNVERQKSAYKQQLFNNLKCPVCMEKQKFSKQVLHCCDCLKYLFGENSKIHIGQLPILQDEINQVAESTIKK